MKKSLLVLFLSFLSFTAFGQEFISSDGDKYIAEFNKHGAVLISENTKYFVENNASGRTQKTKLKLYLGKDCDSFSKIYGKGTWWWANGGFSVDFANKKIGFPRQHIKFPGAENCGI